MPCLRHLLDNIVSFQSSPHIQNCIYASLMCLHVAQLHAHFTQIFDQSKIFLEGTLEIVHVGTKSHFKLLRYGVRCSQRKILGKRSLACLRRHYISSLNFNCARLLHQIGCRPQKSEITNIQWVVKPLYAVSKRLQATTFDYIQ